MEQVQILGFFPYNLYIDGAFQYLGKSLELFMNKKQQNLQSC